MYIPRNASPLNHKRGYDDKSIPPLVRKPVGSPIHKPLVFGFSPRGREDEAYPLAGDNLLSMVGRQVLDSKGPYATFNTPYLQMFNENANEVMFQRVMPDDATTATHRMCAEYWTGKTPIYQRNPLNGEIQYDENGDPLTKGEMDGVFIAFRQVPINETNGLFRAGRESNGVNGKLIPLFDIKGPWRGVEANGFGYRLASLHPKSDVPVDESYTDDVGARVYSLEFMETLPNVTTPVNWPTLKGQTTARFSFMPGAHHSGLRQDLDFADVVPAAWRRTVPDIGMLPEDGPFEEFYLYESNIEMLTELVYGKISNPPRSPYLVDIFGGVDTSGNPYDGLVVNPTSATGTSTFSSKHTHFLEGGSDGKMNNDVYDELVRRELSLFPYSGKVKYANELKYDLGCFWDSGFSFATKEAITNLIGRSRNTFIFLVCQQYNQDPLDLDGEESAKIALNEMCAALPESTEFGTPVARAIIMGQHGIIRNSSYKKRVPANYSLANLFSKYMGSGEGVCKPEYRFGRGRETVIEDLTDISLPYKHPSVYATDWDVGLIAIRSYDYYRSFIPATCSVYPNERSVLKNGVFSFLMTYVFRVSDKVWADASGEFRMTREEYADDISADITKRLAGKLDDIADITPHAYFTAEDIANGNSITIDIKAEGNVMKTLHNTSIRVYRRED